MGSFSRPSARWSTIRSAAGWHRKANGIPESFANSFMGRNGESTVFSSRSEETPSSSCAFGMAPRPSLSLMICNSSRLLLHLLDDAEADVFRRRDALADPGVGRDGRAAAHHLALALID